MQPTGPPSTVWDSDSYYMVSRGLRGRGAQGLGMDGYPPYRGNALDTPLDTLYPPPPYLLVLRGPPLGPLPPWVPRGVAPLGGAVPRGRRGGTHRRCNPPGVPVRPGHYIPYTPLYSPPHLPVEFPFPLRGYRGPAGPGGHIGYWGLVGGRVWIFLPYNPSPRYRVYQHRAPGPGTQEVNCME